MRIISAAVVCLLASGLAFAQAPAPASKCPPPARIDSARDTYGTTVVADPYRWLEDQKNPETRAWIELEQKCTEAALSRLSGRDAISARLEQFYHRDNVEAPAERGGR
jgi:prolyl oligopeptidase